MTLWCLSMRGLGRSWPASKLQQSRPTCFEKAFPEQVQLALEEATAAERCQQERRWKLFLLQPRMLLHRPPRGRLASREKLIARFQLFAQDHCAARDAQAAVRRRRWRRKGGDDVDRRATRADLLVGMGEVSSTRQTLDGVELAPRTNITLQRLSDHPRRPTKIREPLPMEVANHVPDVPLEHLRVLLDSRRCQHLHFKVAERLTHRRIGHPCALSGTRDDHGSRSAD